jgi:hypothetical protein
MGKLYFLDEEEKNRILSLHEGATNRQYLNEDAISDFEAKLPKETKDKFLNMKLAWEGGGTNEKGIVDVLNSFTPAEYNLYNQYLALKKPEGVTGISGIINAEMGYDDIENVDKVVAALKRFGLTGTYETIEKDRNGNKYPKPFYKEKTFKITKSGAPVVDPKKTTVVDPKKTTVVDTKKAYQERVKQVNQQTINTTKEIQKLLGQEPTGNLDSTYVEKVIDLLKQ